MRKKNPLTQKAINVSYCIAIIGNYWLGAPKNEYSFHFFLLSKTFRHEIEKTRSSSSSSYSYSSSFFIN
jgi:hypothetical protein